MELALGLLVVLAVVVFVLYEFRFRYPDEVILSEGPTGIRVRSGALYPRHFSLALKRTTSPLQFTVDASAAGNVDLRMKLVGAVAPSMPHLEALIRIGGWNTDAAAKAAQELQLLFQGLVREYTERHDIGALSSQKVLDHLTSKLDLTRERFGLEVVSLAVQSFEPVDAQIFEALRKQEQARIFEQTEILNHQTRINAAKAKLRADEEILVLENEMATKKAQLEKLQLQNEAALAGQRLEEELKGKRLRLQFEKEELEVLKSTPELLLLTPQAARLAEASQKLKNAHTIISLSPQDQTQGMELMALFQNFLERALDRSRNQAR